MEKSNPGIQSKVQKTILVVDDDEAIRLLITSFFEKDYKIVTMNDGHEALVYLGEGHVPDLILLDMEMPKMNGRVFLRRVRFGDSTHNKIPIIFITSVSSKAIIHSTLKLNVDDYITKPFKPEELIEKVHQILPL